MTPEDVQELVRESPPRENNWPIVMAWWSEITIPFRLQRLEYRRQGKPWDPEIEGWCLWQDLREKEKARRRARARGRAA
jgi:hypothetical protein